MHLAKTPGRYSVLTSVARQRLTRSAQITADQV